MLEKIEKLNEIDKALIAVCFLTHLTASSNRSDYDRMSPLAFPSFGMAGPRNAAPNFFIFSIQYIDSPPGNPQEWTLKRHLLVFNRTISRHSGEIVGKELVSVIKKFELEEKVNAVVIFITSYALTLTFRSVAGLAYWQQCPSERCGCSLCVHRTRPR